MWHVNKFTYPLDTDIFYIFQYAETYNNSISMNKKSISKNFHTLESRVDKKNNYS